MEPCHEHTVLGTAALVAGAAIVSIISGLFFGVLQPLLAPPTIVGDDGTVYTKVNGGFVEK